MGLAKNLAGSYQMGFLALSAPCLFAAFLAFHLHRSEAAKRSWLARDALNPTSFAHATQQPEPSQVDN